MLCKTLLLGIAERLKIKDAVTYGVPIAPTKSITPLKNCLHPRDTLHEGLCEPR